MERGLEKNSNILVRPVKISATAQPRVIMALSFNRKSYAVPYTYSTTACIWSNLSGRVHNLAWGSRKNIWQSLIRECSLFIESSARAEIYLWWYGKYFCVGSVYLCLWCSFKHQILNLTKKIFFSPPPLKFVDFFFAPYHACPLGLWAILSFTFGIIIKLLYCILSVLLGTVLKLYIDDPTVLHSSC